MFEPGDKKPERSGRKPGTPNKKTQAVIDLVEASGKNPILVMLELMSDEDPALRLSAARELAQYLYPKRKALEVNLDAEVKNEGATLMSELTPEERNQFLEEYKLALIAARRQSWKGKANGDVD